VTAAATLHQAGISEVGTAAQAAQALQPLAGEFAFALFSLGIIGTGLISIPVLAGSAAYALGEARGWPVGLSRKPKQAKAFYAALAAAMVLGALANVFQLNPVKALVWAAVINGIVAVPVMVMLMLLGSDRTVMGKFEVSRRSAVLGWAATAVMGVAAVAFIVATVRGGQ
jgi:Mn2+/Fe2+ NRAMP family transporter